MSLLKANEVKTKYLQKHELQRLTWILSSLQGHLVPQERHNCQHGPCFWGHPHCCMAGQFSHCLTSMFNWYLVEG